LPKLSCVVNLFVAYQPTTMKGHFKPILITDLLILSDELRNALDVITKYKSEQSDLEQKLAKCSSQIDDLQTAAAIAEVGKEDEVAKAKRQHNEELASFQHILDGTLSDQSKVS
jgi:Rabaptin